MSGWITPAETSSQASSRFTRNRAAWFLVGAVAVVTPLLWPFGGYILWKLFLTRGGRDGQTAPSPVELGWGDSTGHQASPASRHRTGFVIIGLVGFLGGATVLLLALGYSGTRGASILQSQSDPPCVIVGEGPLGKFELYVAGATDVQCQAELASGREGFGPDSSYSRLYIVHDLPTGTPACVSGVVKWYVYGLQAEELKAQLLKAQACN